MGGLRCAGCVCRAMPLIAVADIGRIHNDGVVAKVMPVGGERCIAHHLDASRIGGVTVVPMVESPTQCTNGSGGGGISDGVHPAA